MKKHIFSLLLVALFLSGCGQAIPDSSNTTKNEPDRKQEMTIVLTKNQEDCERVKPGSRAKYTNKSGLTFTAENIVQLAEAMDQQNFKLDSYKCECNQNKCEFNNKCVSRPWSSHCVTRTDKAWMCNNGYYEFKNDCYDRSRMTEFCEEQFGYGFTFTGFLDGTLECKNIGTTQKRFLHL